MAKIKALFIVGLATGLVLMSQVAAYAGDMGCHSSGC